MSLAACGGSGSSPLPFRTLSTATVTNATLDFEINRLTVPGQIIFDPNPETKADLIFSRTPDEDLNGFEGYLTADGSSIYLRSGSPNSAVATIISDQSVAEGFVGSIIARNVPTELPLSGSADYSGDYAAILTAETTGDRIGAVTGDVDLVADFETGLVAGTVSNRQLSNGRSLNNETLVAETTGVDGGTYGSVQPDIPNGEDFRTGDYALIIAGPNAEEIVGYTNLSYAIGPVSLIERGAFRASR